MLKDKIIDKNLYKQQAYIDGKWIDADNKMVIEVFDPSNQKSIATVPFMGEAETVRAIDSAYKSFVLFREFSAQERSDLLYKWYDEIINAMDDLATIVTYEQGKTLVEAKKEILYSASFIKWFAEEAKRIYGNIIQAPKHAQQIFVTHEPVGVVAIITPWNFPSSMIVRKLSAAIAAGCSAVIKPSELTPLSAFAIGELASRAGFPDGVVNIITGDAKIIAKTFNDNKIVKKISFTGSTRVGKILMSACADHIKRLSLELGGNAPFIIFDDADLDLALAGLIAGKFRNNGQSCIAPNRVYVQKNIYDEFIQKIKMEVAKIIVGNATDPKTMIGPLINQAASDKILALIEDATCKGAKLLLGGRSIESAGYYFQPTLIINVNHQMNIAKTEIFGPVIAIYSFDNEDQVIEMANDTDYGLASYLYTNDHKRIFKLIKLLEYGMVGVNESLISNEVSPFGGIKQSGFGREGSYLGIHEYLSVKYTCWNLAS